MNTPVNFGSAPDLSDCQFSVGDNIVTTGILAALLVGAAIKLKLMGGVQ